MDSNIVNLLGDDVSLNVENIDKVIKQQGVVIRISVGGGRNSYYISPKIYGVNENDLTDDSKEFMSEHIKDGRVSFVPKIYDKQLRAVESKLKKKLKELSVGYEGSFIPLSSYGEFREYFEKCKKEYFEIRDELVDNYPAMYERFVDIAKQSIRDLNAYQAEEELVKIISKLPNREAFKESFRVDINVSAFPTMENLEMFDESIQEDIKEGSSKNNYELIKESMISVINEGLAPLSSILRSGKENDKIHQRVILGLQNAIKRMGHKNIFGNQKLEEIRINMAEIVNLDFDSAMENAERLLAELYNYSLELKLQDDIDLNGCPFTREELETVYDLYH